MHRVSVGTRARQDAGTASLELAIVCVTLIGFLYLMVFALQLAMADQAVQDAASEGARAASIVNTGDAPGAATVAVDGSLGSSNVYCAELKVTTSPDPVEVTVEVSCRFPLNNLPTTWLGVTGSRTFTAEATEIIDVYRADG